MFSGNKLQVKFNKNIGFITPRKTKQSTKTRTFILIILAISRNVHSKPGPGKQNTTHKPRKQGKLRKNSNLPDWIYDLSQCSKHQLLKCKNLQRKCASTELLTVICAELRTDHSHWRPCLLPEHQRWAVQTSMIGGPWLVVPLKLNEEQKIWQAPIISLTSERVRSRG